MREEENVLQAGNNFILGAARRGVPGLLEEKIVFNFVTLQAALHL